MTRQEAQQVARMARELTINPVRVLSIPTEDDAEWFVSIPTQTGTINLMTIESFVAFKARKG